MNEWIAGLDQAGFGALGAMGVVLGLKLGGALLGLLVGLRVANGVAVGGFCGPRGGQPSKLGSTGASRDASTPCTTASGSARAS